MHRLPFLLLFFFLFFASGFLQDLNNFFSLRKDLACAKSLWDDGESLVVLTQVRKNLYGLVMVQKRFAS